MGKAPAFWLWDFFGHLHPLAVHFPVALLLFAALLELLTLKNYRSGLRQGINALIIAGTVSATVAAIFGWLLYFHGDYKGNTLNLHLWTGLSTALLALITWILMARANRHPSGKGAGSYRIFLFLTAIGVAVAGHFGANLTHGSDFVSSTLPWNKQRADSTSAGSPEFIEVKAILAHNCYKCHGPDKVKGDLRLDGRHVAFKGGENGPVIIPGDPAKSELYQRIALPAGHKDLMPAKEKKLSDKDIATIMNWIAKGAIWPEDGSKPASFRVAKLEPRNPPLPSGNAQLVNPVDRWTDQYFRKAKFAWPEPVSDPVYLKRIYMDIIGLLPTPAEQDTFINDKTPQKREAWVKKLLSRNDDYALHWLSFWNDALRNDYTGTGYITGGRYNITDWLYRSLRDNKPYDQFVRELISPSPESQGFVAGIKWRGVVNASQRTEMQAAQNVSQVFLGLNLKCASCHNSFISDLKLEDAYAFANIFADTALEVSRCEKPTGKFVDARMLWKQLGNIDARAPAAVKQRQLAENLTKREDGRLYRTLVNRVWAQLMGRGLVEPVDVMDNEPWHQDLLDWMAFNFAENKANVKDLIAMIVTSRTYQLPSVGYKDVAQLGDQKYQFRGMARKRMSAEQFSDAVSSIVFPVFADSNIRYNPFSDARYTNFRPQFIRASQVANNGFLTALGRPSRETVVTSRESQANLLQALELTNGTTFNTTLKNGALQWVGRGTGGDPIIADLYKRALGRKPSAAEWKAARKVIGNKPGTENIQDLFWAILMLPEFQIIY